MNAQGPTVRPAITESVSGAAVEGGVVGVGTTGVVSRVAVADGAVGVGKGLVGTTDWGVADGIAEVTGASEGSSVSGVTVEYLGVESCSHAIPTTNKIDTASTILIVMGMTIGFDPRGNSVAIISGIRVLIIRLTITGISGLNYNHSRRLPTASPNMTISPVGARVR